MVKKHAKILLKQALMQLLENASLDKIDVRELAEKAGLSRQTFYYNFKNKQDMIVWIFNKNNEIAKQAFCKSYALHDYILTVLNIIAQYPLFYINVLLDDAQKNNLLGPFEQTLINSVQEIEKQTASRRMTTKQWNSLIFFAFGTKGMVKYWLSDNMRTSPEAMTEIILANIPATLEEYIYSLRI